MNSLLVRLSIRKSPYLKPSTERTGEVKRSKLKLLRLRVVGSRRVRAGELARLALFNKHEGQVHLVALCLSLIKSGRSVIVFNLCISQRSF
jgi:hypothetical protein